MQKRMMRFPGGKAKAVTLSYDDSIEADKKLVDLMEQYQIKGTFNLIPGWFKEEGEEQQDDTYRLVSPKKALEIYNSPMVEVANHGYTHKFMSSLTSAEMADDMVTCRKELETLFERDVRGMAYPYGWYSEELKQVLKMCGVVYSRTVCATGSFGMPSDWLTWHPTCHHDNPELLNMAKHFVEEEVQDSVQLFYVWGHTFEFERNNNWEVMEEFMKTVSGKEDIWYATNIEIYDYVKAYEGLIISADGKRIKNPSKTPVWLEVDGTIYEVKDEIVL